MDKNIKFTFSQIRYIVCLHRLSREGNGVKNVELATALGFKKPSVHNMLKSLSELGVVRHEAFGLAFFTDEGMGVARKYAFCYELIERKMAEICGDGAVSENAICAILADMPPKMINELYSKVI